MSVDVAVCGGCDSERSVASKLRIVSNYFSGLGYEGYCGMVSPSAFAVLSLTTGSSVVGCSTGRSLRALQDFVHIRAGATVQIFKVLAVRHQAAFLSELPGPVDGRKPACVRQHYDLRAMCSEEGTFQHEDAIGTVHGLQSRVQVSKVKFSLCW